MYVVFGVIGALAAPATDASGLAASQLPSDLQHVIAAEGHLKLTGYVEHQTVSKTTRRGNVTFSRAVLTGRTRPAQLTLLASTNGLTADIRAVGAYLYWTSGALARFDGGYQWLRAPATGVDGLETASGAPLTVVDFYHAQIVYAASDVALNAERVVGAGASTIHGQAVTQFVAISPGRTTRMFVAADGLLVRSVTVSAGTTTTTTVSPTVPRIVAAPPRRQTISRTRLDASARARADRILQQALAG